MSYRSSDLAITPKLKHRLRMILTIYPDKAWDTTSQHHVTMEDLADAILNDAIKREFPLVLEMEKEIAKIERNMIEKGKVKQ